MLPRSRRAPPLLRVDGTIQYGTTMHSTRFRNLSSRHRAFWKRSLSSLLEIGAFVLILAAAWYTVVRLTRHFLAI